MAELDGNANGAGAGPELSAKGVRLTKFEIRGLFGLFNHSISLRTEERITIIHAPNGFGKTVILKLIEGFFGGSLLVFRSYQYEYIKMSLSDGSVIEVRQVDTSDDLFDSAERSVERRSYEISYTSKGETLSWDPMRDRASAREMSRQLSPSSVERYIPHLRRLPSGLWRDLRVGDTLDFEGAFLRYPDHLPVSARHSRHPEWLDHLRKIIPCRLIETQRLMIKRRPISSRDSDEQPLFPAVKSYAEELAQAMGRALEESATLSQSLDRTFPNRLLKGVGNALAPKPEAELRQRLYDLELRRARLTKAGLLDRVEEDTLISQEKFDRQTRRILTEYVSDAERKLSVYDSLLTKIELFTEILNSRLQFKSVVASRHQGFLIKDLHDRVLDVSNLSSGEQHELVIVYDLVFKTQKDALILIDEPEISLHVAWQKRFLIDLTRIIKLSPMDIILSTHSPQLIGGYLSLAVQLRGPEEAAADV